MLSIGSKVISSKLEMILLCKQMGWDYYTYQKQPSWFLDILREVNNADARYQNMLNKQNGRQ